MRTTLGFESKGREGLDMWAVAATDDGFADSLQGRAFADEFLEHGTAVQLPHIVEAMMTRGALSAIELGFLTRLAEAALRR